MKKEEDENSEISNILDNPENDFLYGLTLKIIKEKKKEIIRALELPMNESQTILHKLKEYRFIDDIQTLKYGAYIRFISLKNPNEPIRLNTTVIFTELNITPKGTFIIYKSFGFSNRHFQLNVEETLVFQKITHEEWMILNAINILHR